LPCDSFLWGTLGALPQTPPKNLFENILATLGANLPSANIAKVLGNLQKPSKKVFIYRERIEKGK
jgi:hypothetical protein